MPVFSTHLVFDILSSFFFSLIYISIKGGMKSDGQLPRSNAENARQKHKRNLDKGIDITRDIEFQWTI